jgi:twitching motility protein PilU
MSTTGTTIDFTSFLKLMAHQKASDLFITAGMPPSMKVHGKISPITQNPLTPQQSRDLVLNVMTPQQREEFEKTHECNFAIGVSGVGRFRVSCFYQRNQVGMVLRRIETKIPTVEELNLPPVIKTLAMTKRGIILFVGATGTGKSTSLAAMIGYRNMNSTGHIITIEDPIEFVHKHEGCIVTQREVGIDTDSWDAALKNTLRQAPGRDHDRRSAHPRRAWTTPSPSPKPVTWCCARCTPTTPTRRWTASSTSSRKTAAISC